MNDEILRQKVRLLKAQEQITYKEIADTIGIKQRSMYNWIAGQYDFSSSKKRLLYNYLSVKLGE